MTSPSQIRNPRVGAWRALGDFRLRDMFWPEGLFALVIGAGGSTWALSITTVDDRTAVMGSVLTLAAALLTVVFAALAIVISIPSQSYIRLMQETPNGGVIRFLNPFLLEVGVQISLVLLAIAFQLAAGDLPETVENVAFTAIGVVFVFGLLDMAALARQLVRHAFLRGELERVDAGGDEDGTVHPLPRRRQP